MQNRGWLSLLALCAAVGCGDAHQETPVPPVGGRWIGQLQRLVVTPRDPTAVPVDVERRSESVVGSNGIGSVTVVYFDFGKETAPDSLTVTPDGTAWISKFGEFVRVAPDDTVSALLKPHEVAGATGMVGEANGMIWLTNWADTFSIVRVDSINGRIENFQLPPPLRRPTALAVSNMGGVWLAGGDQPIVGHVNSHSEVFVVAEQDAGEPITIASAGLAVSKDGGVFLSDFAEGRIGRVKGTGFVWTDLGGPAHAPSGLAAGPDNSVWFVALGRPNEVGRIDNAGALTALTLPIELQSFSDKSGSTIALGPDGAFWFTLSEVDVIGRVTAAGELGFLRLDDATWPRVIAFDARGRIWVTTATGVARIERGAG